MNSKTLNATLASAVQLHRTGRLDEAESLYRRVLALDPDQPDALGYLGILLHQRGRPAEGREPVMRAIALAPQTPRHWCNAAPVLLALGEIDESIRLARRAIELRPDYAEAFYHLGLALRHKGELDASEAAYRRAVELKPDLAPAWNSLGIRLRERGRMDEAIECYRRAVAIQPNFAEAHNNLGVVFRERGDLDAALAAHELALKLEPRSTEIQSNIGTVLKDMGRLTEAVERYRLALAIRPDPHVGSNLLYAMLFDPEADAGATASEHANWNRLFAEPLAREIRPHENDFSPDRRLRIGFVSPDFREHPIGRFLLPLLENHDRERFEMRCYSDVRRPDAVTERLRRTADAMQSSLNQSDRELAERIRGDRIDILVDLTMHMSANRLLVFARKPAPVQVTWLAYCGTTGLSAMDWRLTDPILDPPNSDTSLYSERSLRLRHYWCYPAPDPAPPIAPSPAGRSGPITFGCLNNFAKVTPRTLETWMRILQRVPDARLILHCREGTHRRTLVERIAAAGIDGGRVEFVGIQPMSAYFQTWRRIDIALDPFPYPGGTTTCDALWTGVPVVTLPGATALSRGGLSILSAIGMTRSAATDEEDYVRIAVGLATDRDALSQLRSGLRQTMLGSPLMDGPAFARDFERALHEMWAIRCADGSKS